MAMDLRHVDASAVERALAALVDALGSDAVTTAEEELREYRDPYDYKTRTATRDRPS